MGYFTYANARKAAVRSKRTEDLLYRQARTQDGSGYQDSRELGEDIGYALFVAWVFVSLPVRWLASVSGWALALLSVLAVAALTFVTPWTLVLYGAACVAVAVMWREEEPS